MRATVALLVLATGCIPRLYGDAIAPWDAPDNGWGVVAPPGDLAGEGWDIGDTPPDFRLADQFGDTVSLWQFYGSVILVDISTMWCAPCRDLATHTEETWLDYREDGFVYLTILQEDTEGQPPGAEGVQLWAEYYGITAPVLEDGTKEGTGAAIQQGQFPAVLLVDRELNVAERINPVDDATIRAAIEDLL